MKISAKRLGLATAVSLALSSGAAMADPLTELGFSQSAGWDSNPATWSFDSATSGFEGLNFENMTDASAPAGTFNDMNWCSPTEPTGNGACSAINITSFDNGSSTIRLKADLSTLDEDGAWNEGDWWVIDTLTQTNNALRIPDGFEMPDPLWTADTLANLRIYDDPDRVAGSQVLEDLDSRVTIEFWESLNATPCTGENRVGTICDDEYRIAADELAPVSFELDGYVYSIGFTLIPGVGTEFEIDGNELTVWTGELDTSNVSIAMSWNATRIPAPGALALMSAGALGFGLYARRRRTA